MRIVVVDDNAMNITVVHEMLKRAGYQDVRAASSAMELFGMLGLDERGDEMPGSGGADPGIDLILLDMMMPRIDGIAACRVIQRHERLRDIPIIIVTAWGDSKKLAEALDAGASDYVTKPINRIELLARIRSALRLKQEKDWRKERDSRLREELRLARSVQAAVLPSPVEEERISIDAVYQPSEELSGDLYAWHRIGEDRYGVAVIDAMGHGISSSLVCMFIASLLKDAMLKLAEPELVIREMNRRALQLKFDDQLIQYYFTAIYMVVDVGKGSVEYVNAGHPPGLLLREGRQAGLLSGGSAAIGLFEDIAIETQTMDIHPGDRLVLMTDGLLEAVDGPEENRFATMLDRLGEDVLRFPEAWQSAFFEEIRPERPDDRCLVWITVK